MSSIVTDRPILPTSPTSSSSSATSPIEAGIHPHPSISIDRVDRRVGEFGSTSSSFGAHSNNVDQHRFILHPTHPTSFQQQPTLHHSQHTPSTAARRHRPTEIDPMDTTRRINYRPTALPMDHERNVDDEAGGARWLSEDEGGETVRKTTRAGSFGEVSGGSRAQVQSRRQQAVAGRSTGRTGNGRAADKIDAGPPSGSGLGLGFGPTEGGEDANRLERDAWGVPSSSNFRAGGSRTNDNDQSSRSGLEQAKAHWKSVATSSRMRLRRAVSSELVTSPTATTTATMGPSSEVPDDTPAPSNMAMSGHPIAATSGMPMPGLRSLAPPPKASSGGVPTYQATEPTPEPSGSKPRNQALNLEHATNPLVRQSSDANAAQALSGLAMGDIPDFATGRGGDGIGGSGVPPATSGMTAVESVEESLRVKEEEKQKRKLLIDKLSEILRCPCCPIDSNDQVPFLNHPVTLFCGHTVSSSHVRLPQVPVPDITGYPATDAFGIMEAYQARRLALWAKVACPLPGCKNNDGQSAAHQHHHDAERADLRTRQSERTSQATYNVHGVAYYPPLSELAGEMSGPTIVRCPPPSDLSGLSTDKTLMDVSVAKILALVWKQMSADALEDRRLEMTRPSFSRSNSVDTVATETDGEEADGEDEGYDEDLPHKRALSGPSSRLTAPGLTRTSSKRRRQKTEETQRYPSPPHKRSSQLPPGQGSAVAGQRPSIGRRKPSISFEKELCAVMECDVCAQILYLPVTTPCQHTFCSKCLARSLDHSSKCPLCRQDLPAHTGFQELAVNKVLTDIVIHAFPEEHAERMRSIESDERDSRLDTPIFVCALAFPHMPTILHVFEPRYRLMLRRCIESGTPRFGMVLPARGAGNGVAGVLEYGTMLDIKSIQMLPDGRSMVEAMGSHRFRLLEKGSLDGYTVGRVERIEDIAAEDETALEQMSMERARARANQSMANPAPAPNSNEAPTRPGLPRSQTSTGRPASSGAGIVSASPAPANDRHEPSTAELMGMCKDFIEQLRSGSAPWLLQRLNSTYGPMPEDASTFSYWMALVMPIDEYEKARLLPIRSPRLRLRLIVHWVEQLRSSWWFSSGCVVG